MKWKGFVIGLTAVLLLLVVPVVWTQTQSQPLRQLRGVRLAETDYEAIQFRNEEQQLSLGGMLFVPEGEGPFPAVIIIHGNGTSNRNNPWYLTLVDHLQRRGIVVLLPDKRGSGASGGDWQIASFDDLATDTLAAVSYLRQQEGIALAEIGLIGMSQGGHFSPLVANRSPHVDFVVNVVGAAVPLHEQLVYEETHNLRQMGLLPGISDLIAYPAAWSIREIRQPEFWTAVGNFDPLPHWREVDVPALVLYGQEDTNTPSEKSAALLRSLDKENIDVQLYAGSGHALADPVGQGHRFFRQDAMVTISDFILMSTE